MSLIKKKYILWQTKKLLQLLVAQEPREED